MDSITRTDEEVRDGDIVDFGSLSALVLTTSKNGRMYHLGLNKSSPKFVYHELDSEGNIAPTKPRQCDADELKLLTMALNMAATAGYQLCTYPGPAGFGVCQWNRTELEVYDHPVAPTALLLGWIS